MDEFDDDFGDLDDFDLLQELEDNAIRSHQTQQQKRQNSIQASTGTAAQPVVIDDITARTNDAAALRELARLPGQNTYGGRLTAAAAPPPLALPAYSQGLANAPASSTAAPKKPQSFYPGPSQQRASLNLASRPNVGAANARSGPGVVGGIGGMPYRAPGTTGAPTKMGAPGFSAGTGLGRPGRPTAAETAEIAAMQARIRMLETDLLTAQGKASMMQNKYEGAQRKHEIELQKVQKQNAEETARERKRAEDAIAAQRNATTELEFAKQDLREEVERAKKGRRAGQGDAAPTTPRKTTAARSTWNVADGFDEVEMLPSPTKGFARRLKDATGAVVSAVDRSPSKGKRRRPITDSPTKPLETVPVEEADMMYMSPSVPYGRASGAVARTAAHSAAHAEPPMPDEAPFTFIQDVLGHQSDPDEPSTIELFSRYSFPSNRKQTLAFLMLQRIPKLEGKQGTARLMLDFCQLVLGIWSQCLREKYHAPVRALVSLLTYILSRDPISLAPHIRDTVIALAQETVYLVAEPAFHSASGNLENHANYAVRQLASDIDSGATMALLKLVAFGCLTSSQGDSQDPMQASQGSIMGISVAAQEDFWSKMEFEFVLLMLSSNQSPDAFLSMLALLKTSVLPDSIGPITHDPSRDPTVVASLIIDRLSHHIESPPKWSTPSKYTEWDVRLAALGVLDCFAQSSFGKLGLAASDSTLPRLVGVLFPAYRELQDRDLLDEPFHPPPDYMMLSDAEVRAYGIGGFDLDQTLGLTIEQPVAAGMSITVTVNKAPLHLPPSASIDKKPGPGDGDAKPAADPPKEHIPLVTLYVASLVYLLHNILTDPYTATAASIPAKLSTTRGALQGFYLLTMARLGFSIDPAFSLFHATRGEVRRLAAELFELAASPREREEYAQLAARVEAPPHGVEGEPDWFSDRVLGALEEVDLSVVKMEKTAS